MQPDYK